MRSYAQSAKGVVGGLWIPRCTFWHEDSNPRPRVRAAMHAVAICHCACARRCTRRGDSPLRAAPGLVDDHAGFVHCTKTYNAFLYASIQRGGGRAMDVFRRAHASFFTA